MSENTSPLGLGWIPDLPDMRDYSASETKVAPILETVRKFDLTGKKTKAAMLPATADLRAWCSPVENQGALGSCTAHAGVGLVEYFERRAFNRHIDASRLFLYKATRNLLHWTGDTGAYCRTTMKALVLFGIPPEEYWPYDIAKYEIEPSAFAYSFGQSYQAILYYRLDSTGLTPGDLLTRIKTSIAAGLPSMFGFTVYSSMSQASATGKIPWPMRGESVLGGHAVMAVGYDDNLTIKNATAGAVASKGALLIRNSWGPDWGPLGGYLWLPYEYVLRGVARDWWSLAKSEWFDTTAF